MRVIPLHSRRSRRAPHDEAAAAREVLLDDLRQLLLGSGEALPLPSLPDLLSALIALADGSRRKSLLPLATAPTELVLLRRGDQLLVSYYAVDEPTDVRVLDRAVGLSSVLRATSEIALCAVELDADPISRDVTEQLAERARTTPVAPLGEASPPVVKFGGAVERPSVPLAFGFEARIVPVADPSRQTTAHSDIHALLFEGALWVWTRGRRIPLLRGPVMLAVIRMVAGVRALIEARRAGRPANVRLRTGRFVFGVRLASSGERPVQLSLGEGGRLQVPELSVSDAALPILRLASDLLRRLIAADRSQARNLRVSALRDEVRELRKELRAKKARPERLVHRDPERLRAAVARPSTPPASRGPAPPRSLRFDTRWEAEIAGLDAASTFLCGDRLVVAAPRRTVCLGRDEGELIWRNETPASVAFMTGEVLVRATSDGRVSLTSVEDGEVFATRNLAPRVGGPPCGLLAGGRSAPPVVVLAEGSDRLVAIDLRTGDLRWRYGAPVAGRLGLSKTGRILLVTAEDGSVSALDIANGELLWRYLADGSLVSRAVVCGETVLVASGQELAGVELFSGRELWLRRLDVPIAAAPVAATGLAAVAFGRARETSLACFEPSRGELRWMVPDPGVARGAASLVVDRSLVVNVPNGALEAIALDDGRLRWTRRLSHPVADDVPRRLEPILRGGALFVPSASVHVLRPSDGESLGEPLPCELVPDFLRVDERGWVYVAEESGHLAALAPRPQLRLVT